MQAIGPNSLVDIQHSNIYLLQPQENEILINPCYPNNISSESANEKGQNKALTSDETD